nr:MAG TPA: hypothetical protein [Bacteriophage sp.]
MVFSFLIQTLICLLRVGEVWDLIPFIWLMDIPILLL